MAISDAQYNNLLIRITRLEEAVNDIMAAMDQLVSNKQVQQLLTLQATELATVKETVESLQTRVEIIESEPLS